MMCVRAKQYVRCGEIITQRNVYDDEWLASGDDDDEYMLDIWRYCNTEKYI